MKRKFYNSEKIRDIRTLVNRAADLYPDRIAYKEIVSKTELSEHTFLQLQEDMNAFGTKLMEMGLEGKNIAVIGENSYAWVISYLSVINGVGVVIPLDKELSDEDIVKLINKCDADAIICSNTFVSCMQAIKPLCPKLKTFIIMNSKKEVEGFHDMQELIEDGRGLLARNNREYLGAPINTDTMSEILFTSGTTGANKGVMLSQRNIMAVVYGAATIIKPGAVSMSVLPINHSYECSCHILGGIYHGITVCFNDSLKNVTKNLQRFKPEFTIMVPLFLESIDRLIWKNAEETGLIAHLKYGIKFSNIIRKFGFDKREKYFKPILDRFGGKLQQIVCGGAPLRNELIKAFDDLGINIVNGYGITECAPLVAANCTAWKKLGSVGHIMNGCKVRIVNPDENGNGEIQVKGDNVMLGYYKDEESTKATFTEDGWFITGDLGRLDKDNFLYLSGRAKNLIILPNGKNVHPEELEEIILSNIPYIKEAVVAASLGNKREDHAIHAYVYFDPTAIAKEGLEILKGRVKEDIRVLNRKLTSYKRINNVFISEKEFEKTTTNKIKRQLIDRGNFKSA